MILWGVVSISFRTSDWLSISNFSIDMQYITNALIGNAERRGRNHVVEFGPYGVNLLNKELAKFVSKIALQNFLTTLAINKDLKKLSPQLYQVKMKICYDQGCNDIGVVMETK